MSLEGSGVKSAFVVAGAVAALSLSACVTAAPQEQAAFSPASIAAAADPLVALTAGAEKREQLSPLFANAEPTAAPVEAMRSHEGQAAALWTGALYNAHGKILDERVTETPIRSIDEALPYGWRRRGEAIVHNESGLACAPGFNFDVNEKPYQIKLTSIKQFDNAGRDVACHYLTDGDAAVTIYASFYPEVTVEQHAKAVISAIRQHFTINGVLETLFVDVKDKTTGRKISELGPLVVGGFDVGEIIGVPFKTALWLGERRGWHVKVRATYPQSDPVTEVVAATMFSGNYLNVEIHTRDNPTPTGPEV